jgi:hypothetical protein
MRSALRQSALLLAFTFVVAGPGVAPADDIDNDITGTVGRAAAEHAPALTDEQRGRIFFGVINLPDVPDESLPVAEASTEVPGSVELQDLPAMVVREVPSVRNLKFVKLEDYILVVSPATRSVVAQIPRFKLTP